MFLKIYFVYDNIIANFQSQFLLLQYENIRSSYDSWWPQPCLLVKSAFWWFHLPVQASECSERGKNLRMFGSRNSSLLSQTLWVGLTTGRAVGKMMKVTSGFWGFPTFFSVKAIPKRYCEKVKQQFLPPICWWFIHVYNCWYISLLTTINH